MRAEHIVRRLVESCRGVVHRARFEAVVAAADAATRSPRVSLTEIGRSIRGKLLPRHGIKRIDRLLGNWRLFRELHVWYRALLACLAEKIDRLVILVDWTQVHGEFWALTASIPFVGRSIPILTHVHPETRLGAREIHNDFLLTLRSILPTGCKVVIVADAGFRSPFFRACKGCGMQFVIRLRNDKGVAEFGSAFPSLPDYTKLRFKEIFERAGAEAQCLGEGRPYAKSPDAHFTRLVLGPRPDKAELRKKYADDYPRKRATEPILLATNLENEPAEAVAQIYNARMQIEETFRDTKNPRFGLGLEYARCSNRRRLEVLLMLVTLAFVVTVLVGAAARDAGLEPAVRARSGPAPVLSVFTLGMLAVRLPILRVRLQAVWRQRKRIHAIHAAFFPRIKPPRSENHDVPLPLPHALFCADCGWRGRSYGWPP